MTQDDSRLLRRWIDGRDGEAFNDLASRHAVIVYSVCRRILRHAADVEDTAQECFLKLALAQAAPTSCFRSWLYSMAAHLALDHRRRMARC